MQGWAESDVGEIVFNCETMPNGNCDDSDFKVSNSTGPLSGWAWNENIGWISFNCQDLVDEGIIAACGDVGDYKVEIVRQGNESFFRGWAWNDVVGWIVFDCQDLVDKGVAASCADVGNFKIQTSAGAQSADGVLESNVFDTGVNDPAYNYILWSGSPLPTDTSVQFQVASSDLPDNGGQAWVFDSPVSANSNARITIGPSHQGNRYIRYRVLLTSDDWQQSTPVIDDIIINYSP